MRLLADASVDMRIVRRLRESGIEVIAIIEDAPSLPDLAVLAQAFDTGAILLTEDKDFGDLVVRDGLPTNGVILIRARVASEADTTDMAKRIGAALGDADHAFVTLTDQRKRVRKLTP